MKPEFLSDIAISITPVGSRITCDPPPTDTDEDWLVIIKHPKLNDALSLLDKEGFKLDNPNEHYRPEEGRFNSWRKGETNLIVTRDWEFHRRFLAATHVAKNLNVMSKQDRVTLFQACLYGNGGHEVSYSMQADFDYVNVLSPTNVQSQET